MTLTISKAAAAAGVNIETIRYYERRGLIERPRRPMKGGYRDYPPDTVARVRFIQRAQQLGFSLREIEELLSLRSDPHTDCGDVRERAVEKLKVVNERLAELARMQRALKQVIAACPGGGGLTACSILEALDAAEAPAAGPSQGQEPYP